MSSSNSFFDSSGSVLPFGSCVFVQKFPNICASPIVVSKMTVFKQVKHTVDGALCLG